MRLSQPDLHGVTRKVRLAAGLGLAHAGKRQSAPLKTGEKIGAASVDRSVLAVVRQIVQDIILFSKAYKV